MSHEADAPSGAHGRRDSWSLRSIIKEVSGKNLEEFQDPDRAPHPYLRVKPPPRPASVDAPAAAGAPEVVVVPPHTSAPAHPPEVRGTEDPVARVYPPLTGAVGRALHGHGHEHDAETLNLRPGDPLGTAGPGRPSSPSRRPERVYLHYLMLHLDRLSEHALLYLRHAVDEELAHRAMEMEPAALPPPMPD